MRTMRDVPERGRPIRSISAVLPLVGDLPDFSALLAATIDALGDAAPEFEVLIVERGRSGAAARAANDASRAHPAVRTVRLDSGNSYGAATRAGIAAATKQYVLLLDPAGGYDPLQVEQFVQWGDRYDAIAGFRRRGDDVIGRRALAGLSALLLRALFGATARDSTCGFALVRATMLTTVPLRSSSRAIHVELLYRLRERQATVHQVPVVRRRQGVPEQTWRARVGAFGRAGVDVVRLKWHIMAERRAQARAAEGTPRSEPEHDATAGTS